MGDLTATMCLLQGRGRQCAHDIRCFGLKNALNRQLALYEGKVAKCYRHSHPTILQVEPTTVCNLKCPMCGRTYDTVRPSHMSWKSLERILDGVWSLQEVSLQGIGEPLLHPDISRLIALIKSRGLKLGFVTNAVPLDSSIARDIVDAQMDWIGVSFDAATKELYERIRVGARFEHVLENIRGLVEQRRSAGGEKPIVSIAVVAMRWNLRELPGIVELFGGIGVDQIAVQNFNFEIGAIPEIFGNDSPMLTEEDAPKVHRVFDECRRVAREKGVQLSLPPVEAQWNKGGREGDSNLSCILPWTTLYVTVDGFITPCCNRPDGSRFAFGNILEQPFETIWKGRLFREFRKSCMTMDPPLICKGCTLNQPL